jgi:hypothetical protein
MPHAIEDVHDFALPKSLRSPKTSSRALHQLHASLNHFQHLSHHSPFSQSITRYLQTSIKHASIPIPIPITQILSLGLGSLQVTKGQTRRSKQLTILLAIRDIIAVLSNTAFDIYTQDPSFTRVEESFLTTLGIQILRTPSGSSLGEAASVISNSTLIYTPFLTIEVYEQLLVTSGLPVPILFYDDFNALLGKWLKHSGERRQVEGVVKAGLGRYKRRAEVEEGFWAEEVGAFPMAVYVHEKERERVRARM